MLLVAGVLAALAIGRVVASLRTLGASAVTPALSRFLSRWVRTRTSSGEEFFRADGAPEEAIARRRGGLDRLARQFAAQAPQSRAWSERIRDGLSDLRFTDANRVPFPFARVMRERFALCSVVTESRGPWPCDLDGRWSLDVGGSYGLNVAGYSRYKEWMERGLARVASLGPVLGPLHPIVAENIEMLRGISRLDEVSFHMSGTEAVMAALRLARFNTRRKLIVCFGGAYHG
jgi:glutamate-1-semialdehyde 2,1-aminomutase